MQICKKSIYFCILFHDKKAGDLCELRKKPQEFVMSGYMEPTLKTGGIVFTDTKRTEPSVGDIVTFRNAKGKVSHRVVAKQKQSYITKGDANNTEDVSLLEPEQIIGTVILTVPLLGYAAELLKEKTVEMLLLLMIFQELVFLVIEWKGERIEKRRRKQI